MDGNFLMKGMWGFVVFLLAALLFSVFWQEDWELANQQVTAVRFGFYRVMGVEALCGIGVACFAWKGFRFHYLDGLVFLFGGYLVGRNWLCGEPVVYRVELILLLFLLYFILRVLFSLYDGALKVVLLTFIGAVGVECIWGAGQLYGGVASGHALYRLTGSFFNPGPYAGFLAMGLPVALAFFLVRRENVRFSGGKQWVYYGMRCLAGGVLLLSVMLLPVTMSRGSWLATLAGTGVVLGKHYGVRGRIGRLVSGRRHVFIGGIVVAVIFFLVVVVGMYGLKKDSADGRMLIWKMDMLAMQEHPWMGVGSGRFGGAYGEVQAAYFLSGKATPWEEWVAGVPEYGFNEYLQMGVEGGLIGLALLTGILLGALIRLFFSDDPEGRAVLGSLTAFVFFAFFSYPLGVLPLCIVFVMLLAMAVTRREENSFGKEKSGNELWRKWCIPGLALLVAGIIWSITGGKEEERRAYVHWREEQSYFKMEIYKGTEENYGKLYPFLFQQPRFLFEYGLCLSRLGQYEAGSRLMQEATCLSADPMFFNIMGKNQQALQRFDLAADYFRRAAATVPTRLYPLYLLCQMYFESGQIQRGMELGKVVLDKEPKVMSEAVKEMKSEIREWINKNQ